LLRWQFRGFFFREIEHLALLSWKQLEKTGV